MSESKQSPQSPKIKAVAPLPQEGGSNGEFVVHTKHTCDMCFRLPIIGQRYASEVQPNFDLCARCLEAYSGPVIGLTEAVLIRDKKLSRDFVLKLKIINGGEVQIRRIKVSEVWGKSVSQLSFEKMMSLAASFALPENEVDNAGLAAFTAKAKATYVDEDGDEITMTSNDELDDAFLQVLERAKPFLITVAIPQDEAGKVSVVAAGKAKGIPKRVQVRKVELSKKAFAVSIDKSPLVGCKSKNLFIHARHTCDGCQKTPIVGTRYNATKIPDFDLCATCFEKYEGEDLDFKPEIQERDRRMQQRWLNKGLYHASAPSNIAGIWDCSKGDLAEFLKKVQESGASIESATVYHARPPLKGFSVAESKSPEKLATNDTADSLKEAEESAKVEDLSSLPTIGKPPESPSSCNDESFLSGADGNGSIAEAIGHTLDVCVAAIEAAILEELVKLDSVEVKDKAKSQEPSESKTAHNYNASLNDNVIAASADAFSDASSAASSMTDIVKRMDEAEMAESAAQIAVPQSKDAGTAAASTTSPFVKDSTLLLTEDFRCAEDEEIRFLEQAPQLGENKHVQDEKKCVSTGVHEILKSGNNIEEKSISFVEVPKVEDASDGEDESFVEMHKVEDASGGEDEWSVVDDEDEKPKPNGAKSQSISWALSPVVLAKWDTELHQLHEMGFLDDRSNVDSLEHLEAAHMGVDSTEKVSVNAAVEHLLGSLA